MFAAPFVRDAIYRHQVESRLDSVMDDADRAAFRQYNGDPSVFLKSLYDRCVLQQGQGAAACERYRSASR